MIYKITVEHGFKYLVRWVRDVFGLKYLIKTYYTYDENITEPKFIYDIYNKDCMKFTDIYDYRLTYKIPLNDYEFKHIIENNNLYKNYKYIDFDLLFNTPTIYNNVTNVSLSQFCYFLSKLNEDHGDYVYNSLLEFMEFHPEVYHNDLYRNISSCRLELKTGDILENFMVFSTHLITETDFEKALTNGFLTYYNYEELEPHKQDYNISIRVILLMLIFRCNYYISDIKFYPRYNTIKYKFENTSLDLLNDLLLNLYQLHDRTNLVQYLDNLIKKYKITDSWVQPRIFDSNVMLQISNKYNLHTYLYKEYENLSYNKYLIQESFVTATSDSLYYVKRDVKSMKLRYILNTFKLILPNTEINSSTCIYTETYKNPMNYPIRLINNDGECYVLINLDDELFGLDKIKDAKKFIKTMLYNYISNKKTLVSFDILGEVTIIPYTEPYNFYTYLTNRKNDQIPPLWHEKFYFNNSSCVIHKAVNKSKSEDLYTGYGCCPHDHDEYIQNYMKQHSDDKYSDKYVIYDDKHTSDYLIYIMSDIDCKCLDLYIYDYIYDINNEKFYTIGYE